eukprot:TRINITY_DN1723_c0_g1_i2.p2 TRINITY_DN1723_c0_g1~~TRINITY_DN1723_c0_g1_i2.p2  ORF type:complete len:100 (+),score=13.64 TRINITY_DN1723_c0_g1_i2:235-534(+)
MQWKPSLVRSFYNKVYCSRLSSFSNISLEKNQLQQFFDKNVTNYLITYNTLNTENDKITVGVYVNGEFIGKGSSKTKENAEKCAALDAIQNYIPTFKQQ